MKLFKLITLLTVGSLTLPAHIQANMFSNVLTQSREQLSKAYAVMTVKVMGPKVGQSEEQDTTQPWYIRHKGKLIAAGSTAAFVAAVYAYVRLNPTTNTSIRIKEAYKNSIRFVKQALGLYGKEQPLPDHLKGLSEALIKRGVSKEQRELILQGARYHNLTKEDIEKYLLEAPGYLLFYGPPGTGKTYIIREIAKLINPDQKLIEVLPGDCDSTSKIAALFNSWREMAKDKKIMVLIDEADALFTRTKANATLFNTMLQEIANAKANKNITFAAATNFKDTLTPSMIRQGRFGDHILIPNPPGKSRMMLFQENLGKIPTASLCLSWIDRIRLAILTRGFNIADINAVIQKAGFSALTHGRKMSMPDFEYAIKVIKASKGL